MKKLKPKKKKRKKKPKPVVAGRELSTLLQGLNDEKLYWFPIAAATNYHKLIDLKQ